MEKNNTLKFSIDSILGIDSTDKSVHLGDISEQDDHSCQGDSNCLDDHCQHGISSHSPTEKLCTELVKEDGKFQGDEIELSVQNIENGTNDDLHFDQRGTFNIHS